LLDCQFPRRISKIPARNWKRKQPGLPKRHQKRHPYVRGLKVGQLSIRTMSINGKIGRKSSKATPAFPAQPMLKWTLTIKSRCPDAQPTEMQYWNQPAAMANSQLVQAGHEHEIKIAPNE